jgi:nucleotide-binding universal stress UspA family protein
MLYTHILAPTDFSQAANHALDFAFEEAKHHKAKLTLLHVLRHNSETEVYYIKGALGTLASFDPDFGGTLPTPQASPPETLRRDFNEEALAQLRDLVPSSFSGHWEVEVMTGDPADTIVQAARESDVDLIVMGTHGRTGLQHVLLGSVAEKVVRHAPCPVLTIRHRGES